MEQVLSNLLNNAADYTPPGTAISIGAEVTEGEWTMSVADDGPGFPKEALGKVFDKFFRVEGSKTGGTGLGLAIARGFVEAHGGTIGVENRPGGGARFTIRLPYTPPAPMETQ
jgi:two-component system sensor histidine kinase KdpD